MSSNAIALLLVTLALGCTSSQAPPPSLTQAEAPRGCALGVPGAIAVATDTADGAALTFTTSSSERVTELRARANDAAAQHGPGAGMGQGHEGRHGEGAEHGLQVMQMPALRTAADDVEGGARIRLAAVDASEREMLRAKVRERAAAMNAPCR